MLSSLLSRKGTAKCLGSCWDSRRAWFTKRACFAWSSEVMIQFMHIYNLSSAFDVREYVRGLQGIDSKVNWDWYCVQKAVGGSLTFKFLGWVRNGVRSVTVGGCGAWREKKSELKEVYSQPSHQIINILYVLYPSSRNGQLITRNLSNYSIITSSANIR